MNKEIQDKLNEIVEALKNEEIVKTYLILKKEIDNDETLSRLFKELEQIKHQMVGLRATNQDDEFEAVRELYEAKNKELNEYPLYVNYLYYKEEVLNLYKEIENCFNKM